MAASRSRPRQIRLNIGGHIFHAAASTLESSTYFARLLSAEFSDLSEDGDVFIDRDGRYFDLILTYLRSGRVEQPTPPLTLEGAIAEAEFFAMDGLVEALRESTSPPTSPPPVLRDDGLGVYVWEGSHPGEIEAVAFDHELRTPDPDEGVTPMSTSRGTLIYSRGPCARENLLAVRGMPKPLPRIWRESGDASTIVAFFTQRYLSRGHYEVDGYSLLMSRGNLGGAAEPPGTTPSSMIASVGMLLAADELLMLEPSTESPTDSNRVAAPLLEQLGLSHSTPDRGLGGLGGGFKRFRWEPFPS